MSDVFDQDDMRRFMQDVFTPHLERFDRHLEDDRSFQEKITAAFHRISSSIEVSTSVQQAMLSQNERRIVADQHGFDNKWVRIGAIGLVFTSVFTAVLTLAWEIWSYTHPILPAITH